jgi:hypothetical protein
MAGVVARIVEQGKSPLVIIAKHPSIARAIADLDPFQRDADPPSPWWAEAESAEMVQINGIYVWR